jgi:hypothetical protein
MALPPLPEGGVKLTLAWALPAVAGPMVGALGTILTVCVSTAEVEVALLLSPL